VDEDVIRSQPWRTFVPYYLVDAVVEVPFGAHPALMPCRYYFDEAHIAEWLRLSQTEEGAAEYLDKYVFGAPDFRAYLDLIGGEERMCHLQRVERLEPEVGASGAEGAPQ
jgi:hypothetical protein